MRVRTHTQLLSFLSKSKPDTIQNKERMGSSWRAFSLLGLTVGFEGTSWDADSCKQQALPNSGHSDGQLGGWTFLDIHTYKSETLQETKVY